MSRRHNHDTQIDVCLNSKGGKTLQLTIYNGNCKIKIGLTASEAERLMINLGCSLRKAAKIMAARAEIAIEVADKGLATSKEDKNDTTF